MIPTESKDSIPKILRYPIRAGELSNLFLESPQFNTFKLTFTKSPSNFYYHKIKLLDNLNINNIIFSINYTHAMLDKIPSRRGSEHDYLKPKWSIRVSSVSEENTKIIKEYLLNEIPSIINWLHKKGLEQTNLVSELYYTCFYFPKKSSFITTCN
jgi:hypothetical protein